MKFSKLTVVVGANSTEYLPYDRGANGAFVFKEAGISLYAPRVVTSVTINDASSDKLAVQLNTPRVVTPAENCCDPISTLGTDLVKTELRFLATTSKSDRQEQIDRHIALLQELRTVIENRETIYA